MHKISVFANVGVLEPLNSVSLLAFLVCVIGLSGCSVDRIDHLHSDVNQQAAQSAVDDFTAFSSQESGIGPTLLKNLDARVGLQQAVAQSRIPLDDTDRATELLSMTWLGLRVQLYDSVGMDGAGAATQPDQIPAYETTLSDLIHQRILKVNAAAQVLNALAAVQKAQLASAQQDLNSAEKQLQSATQPSTPPAATQTSGGASLADLLKVADQFRSAVVSAGQAATQGTKVQQTAGALNQAILHEIDASSDPATAYALAPLLGAGLSKKDLDALDLYVKSLNDQLQDLSVPTADGSNTVAGELQKAIDAAKAAVTKAMTPESQDPSNDLTLLKTAVNDLMTAGTDLSNKSLSSSTTLISTFSGLAQNLSGLIENSGQASNLPSNPTAVGTAFLQTTLSSNTQLQGNFNALLTSNGVKIDPSDLQQIGQIVSDINAQSQARTRRLLQYLTDLSQIRFNILQENARHFNAMAGIAGLELARWEKIGQLNIPAAGFYKGAGTTLPNLNYPQNAPDSELFMDSRRCDEFENWFKAQANDLKVHYQGQIGYVFTTIGLNDEILGSLRRMVETARLWNEASPNGADPSGIRARVSADRVTKAIETVDANLLTMSFSEHVASDDRVRLTQELDEHSLLLDGLRESVSEAAIRLGLGDQLAFHQTGLTDSDLQAFIGITQSVLVGIISSKVH